MHIIAYLCFLGKCIIKDYKICIIKKHILIKEKAIAR